VGLPTWLGGFREVRRAFGHGDGSLLWGLLASENTACKSRNRCDDRENVDIEIM